MAQEDKWAILKKKQAENIARLAKEHPDDWLFSGEMKKPENQRVGFAPSQKSINVLNKYHYDINGLIQKGLAHDATKQSHIYENA